MENSLERGLKLDAPASFSLARLEPELDSYVASPTELRRLHTIYYDTDDLRLARWGCSLHFRPPNEWTLKIPQPYEGAAPRRSEFVFRGDATHIPHEALDLATAYLRGERPEPVAELRTLRSRRHVRSPEGTDLADVVEDDVRVVDGANVVRRFREVEIELSDTAPDEALDVLAELLQDRGAGAPHRGPSNVPALGSSAPIPELPRPTIDNEACAGDLFRAALVSSAERLVHNDAAVRLGNDPEGLHQARVAVRRMRSDLRTFVPILDAQWAATLRERMRWLSDGLSAARDADVLLERLERQAQWLPDIDRHPKELVLHLLRGVRDAAYAQLRTMLRERRYVTLLEDILEAARAPQFEARAQEPARDLVPELMNDGWRKLRKAVRDRSRPPTDSELHRIRIRAKRVRYAAESVAPVCGRSAVRFANWVANLQTILGDQHDAVMSCEQLRQHVGGGDGAFVAGELTALERDAANEARRQWRRAWKLACRPRLRFW